MNRRPLFFVFIIAAVLCSTVSLAHAFDDIDAHHSCSQCGMDRKAFGFSRMLIVYTDGSESGVCSLHCAAIDMAAHKDRTVKSLLVADRDTRELIDAEKAVWTTGGSKRGVMSDLPSWAFSTKDAAEKFVKKYGGALTPWTEVLAAAREEAGKNGR